MHEYDYIIERLYCVLVQAVKAKGEMTMTDQKVPIGGWLILIAIPVWSMGILGVLGLLSAAVILSVMLFHIVSAY